MIRLRRPSAQDIAARIERVGEPFSYAEVGATADPCGVPALADAYDVDRYRFPLGTGRVVFEEARTSLLAWRHFEIPWLALHGAGAPAAPGQVVATLTRAFGLWFLNPCRVAYTEGAAGVGNEAAFAYGTLAGHVERGEERFAVRFDPISEQVTYETLAFSRPAVVLSKLGRPWVRRLQARFASSSADALARACHSRAARNRNK